MNLKNKLARRKSFPLWRDRTVAKILALLAQRPMKPSEVCAELGITKNTADAALSGHRHKIYTVCGGKSECTWELKQ